MTAGKGWATAGFVLGIGASVAGNIAHARPELGAQVSAGFYPVALLVTVEVLARVVWPDGKAWLVVRFGGAGLVALVAAIVSYSHLHGLLVGYGEERVTAVLGPLSVDGLMVVCGFALLAVGRTGVPEPAVPQATDAVPAGADQPPVTDAPEGDPLLATARDRFSEALAAGTVPSARAIRRELHIGHPRAVRVREALAQAPDC